MHGGAGDPILIDCPEQPIPDSQSVESQVLDAEVQPCVRQENPEEAQEKQLENADPADLNMEACTNNCICRQPDNNLFMISCDLCAIWYHGSCVGVDAVSSRDILEYHCPRCEPEFGESLYLQKRKSGRSREKLNYLDINNGVLKPLSKIEEMLASKTFQESPFAKMHGKDFSMDYIRVNGFSEPVLFPHSDGLGMKMPKSNITVMEIAQVVGDIPINVMDVKTQDGLPDWTAFKWAQYFTQHPRKGTLNVISFEVSATPLANMIKRPRIVRELDWVDKYWPTKIKKLVARKPKVQMYCLMSPSGAWTDFHVDFGGSSVYYHLLSGHKVFYFIPPTPRNLELYKKWCKSPSQASTFFADLTSGCFKVDLLAGYTMLIPSGWIHAVLTRKDSIAIGGNFLTDFSIANQLAVYYIERSTNVPPAYRFPEYERLCWYAAMHMSQRTFATMTLYEINGLHELAEFLFLRVMKLAKSSRLLARGGFEVASSEEKKYIKQFIPSQLRDNGLFKEFIKNLSERLAEYRLTGAETSQMLVIPKLTTLSSVQKPTISPSKSISTQTMPPSTTPRILLLTRPRSEAFSPASTWTRPVPPIMSPSQFEDLHHRLVADSPPRIQSSLVEAPPSKRVKMDEETSNMQ
eukprot:Partr_v1_DN27039_c0_g1_i3_m29245 putative demethylase